MLITHSPALVPTENEDDLRRVVRFDKPSGASRSWRVPKGGTECDMAKLARTLSLSMDARALLFCRWAVVFSGETELGALPIWFAKSEDASELGTPSSNDIAFFSASGDSGFSAPVRLLGTFGVPWALVCDGKSFNVEHGHVFKQVVTAAGPGFEELQEFVERNGQQQMTRELWESGIKLGERHGIFTLAKGWDTGADECIEGLLAAHLGAEKFKLLQSEVGKSKARVGMRAAEESPCPDEVGRLYRKLVQFLRNRASRVAPC